jgi:hypothetical protein
MKLEKIAPVAEIISSIAIVVTLVYLSIQTQQTNASLLANSQQTTMLADMALITALIGNPETGVNATKPLAELNEAERQQVRLALAGQLRTREFTWFQYKNGVLDKATVDTYMRTLVRWIGLSESTEAWWAEFSQEIDPEFASYLESLRADD